MSTMSFAARGRPLGLATVRSASGAVRVLQLFTILLMCIPSDIVLRPIGGVGYPAALVGMFGFAVWLVGTGLGVHDAHGRRHPIRGLLCLLWLTTLVSYVLMDRGALSGAQRASGDRFLMQLAVITGAALLAAECLPTMEDIRRVLRVLTWGGGFCGAVAALQFWLAFDVTPFLRSIPGFTLNADDSAITARGSERRVEGTAIHPIELGVVAGILLPLAIHLALHDTERSARSRWLPVALIGLAIPASVSRSAILSVVLAMGTLVVLMPVRQRVMAFLAIPVALAAVFVSAHGLIGTFASYFGMGSSDSSITHRTNNYPYVEQLVRQAPWFGHGGGTYIPDVASGTSIRVLDDQYLKTAIELGLVGVVVLALCAFVPALVALSARRRSRDPELRLLCAALAGCSFAATAAMAAFDALSFPMFYNVLALVIGLTGACHRLARGELATRSGPQPALPHDLIRPRASILPHGILRSRR